MGGQERRREGGERQRQPLECISLDAHFKANALPLSHMPSPCFCEPVSHYLEQADHKLMILLPQPVEYQNYRLHQRTRLILRNSIYRSLGDGSVDKNFASVGDRVRVFSTHVKT